MIGPRDEVVGFVVALQASEAQKFSNDPGVALGPSDFGLEIARGRAMLEIRPTSARRVDRGAGGDVVHQTASEVKVARLARRGDR